MADCQKELSYIVTVKATNCTSNNVLLNYCTLITRLLPSLIRWYTIYVCWWI